MDMVSRLLKNEYVFSVVTKCFTVAIGLAYSIVFARFVGAELKGEFAYILSIVSVASIVLTLGMHQAYPFYRKNSQNVTEYKKQYVSSVMSCYCAYFFCATALSVAFCFNVLLTSILFMSVLWSFNRAIGYVVLVEAPNKRNSRITLFTFFEFVLALTFWLLLSKSFILGLCCVCCCEICKMVFFVVELRSFISVDGVSVVHIKELISFGFLPMLALVLTTLNYKIDVIMLNSFSNVALAGVGVYSIGIAFAEKVLLIPDALQEILLSKLAKDKGAEEVALVCRITLPICCLVAFAIGIVGKPFLDFCFGPEYYGSYEVAIICIVGTLFMVFFKMISQYNIVNRRQKTNMLYLSVAVVVNVFFNLLLVPIFGINGAAAATVIGNLVCAAAFVFDFSRFSGIQKRRVVFLSRKDLLRIKMRLIH